MKKIVMMLLTVAVLSGVSFAQNIPPSSLDGTSSLYYNKAEDQALAAQYRAAKAAAEKAAYEAALENAKIDFSGLSEVMVEPVKSALKKEHPNFTRMVYLGQIDEYYGGFWGHSNAHYAYLFTEYFVVTENGTDYFYGAARRKNDAHYIVSNEKESYEGITPMGSFAADENLSKETLREFKKTLPEALKKHMKVLLGKAPLSSIASVSAEHDYDLPGDRAYSYYKVSYTLKDGSVINTNFVLKHKYHWDGYMCGGDEGEEVVEVK